MTSERKSKLTLPLDEPVPPGLLRRYAALWRTTFQLHRQYPVLRLARRDCTYQPTPTGETTTVRRTAAREPLPVAVSTATDQVVAGGQRHGWVVVRLRVATARGGGQRVLRTCRREPHVSPYNLAYAKASARITGVAEHHLLIQLPPAAHGTASIKGWAYLVIWQRSPVNGSWELKPPFASVELISASRGPIRRWPANGHRGGPAPPLRLRSRSVQRARVARGWA